MRRTRPLAPRRIRQKRRTRQLKRAAHNTHATRNSSSRNPQHFSCTLAHDESHSGIDEENTHVRAHFERSAPFRANQGRHDADFIYGLGSEQNLHAAIETTADNRSYCPERVFCASDPAISLKHQCRKSVRNHRSDGDPRGLQAITIWPK